MDMQNVQKLMKKLPAFVKKFQDADNLDGKLTFADLQFAMDLVKLAAENATAQAQVRDIHQDASPTHLDPTDHAQMMAHLKSLPSLVESDQSRDVSESQAPRESPQWVPILMFAVDLAGKLLANWKKNK